MNTIIEGMSGGDPFEIMLTCLNIKEMRECGIAPSTHDTALLTVRQKDTDLGVPQLEKLGKACLRAAEMIRRRRGKG